MAEIYRRVKGRKIQQLIAMHEDVQDALTARAFEVGARAESALAEHRADGIARIDIEQGDIDRYVVLVDTQITPDETRADNSALSIEFGRAGYIDQQGIPYGQMDGLYILTRASHLPKRGKPVARKRRDRKIRKIRDRGGRE